MHQRKDETETLEYVDTFCQPSGKDIMRKESEVRGITREHCLWPWWADGLTTPKKWEELVQIVEGFDWYISYPHIGKNGNNPYFHVAVTGAKAEIERIRSRVKTAGLFGNKCFSGKPMQNSILQFIQYASREETEPNGYPVIRGKLH